MDHCTWLVMTAGVTSGRGWTGSLAIATGLALNRSLPSCSGCWDILYFCCRGNVAEPAEGGAATWAT